MSLKFKDIIGIVDRTRRFNSKIDIEIFVQMFIIKLSTIRRTTEIKKYIIFQGGRIL